MSACRLCVFNCGNFHSALAAHVMHGTMKSDHPTPPPPFTQRTHTHLHTNYSSPSARLSSKAAQNSALRHMWKQFSQCSEQGSLHTHKQTYTHTHTSLPHTLTQETHRFHAHPLHILHTDTHTPSMRSHVTLICSLSRCSLLGI